MLLDSMVHLHTAYFTKRKVKESALEDAAFKQGDKVLAAAERKPRIWTADTLPRVHALWSSIALTVLKSLPNSAYIGWSPHPWFHLSSARLEDQALTAHFADNHQFTTIVGPSGQLGEKYLDYFKARGGMVRRVAHIPPGLEGVHVSIIGDYLIKIRLDLPLRKYITEIFSVTADCVNPSDEQVSTLNSMKGAHVIELERSAAKAQRILALLLEGSTADR